MTEIRERPILFSGAMVRANREGKKSQTRRVAKPEWFRCLDLEDEDDHAQALALCPYGVVGDRLWTRETWTSAYAKGAFGTLFAADERFEQGKRSHAKGPHFNADDPKWKEIVRWRPSIFLPRWASRDTLEITNVRLERLQDITEEDAKAEGVPPMFRYVYASDNAVEIDDSSPLYRDGYSHLWNVINGKRPGCAWADNPRVWVISYRGLSP